MKRTIDDNNQDTGKTAPWVRPARFFASIGGDGDNQVDMQTETHLDELLGDTWEWEEMRTRARPMRNPVLDRIIETLCDELASWGPY